MQFVSVVNKVRPPAPLIAAAQMLDLGGYAPRTPSLRLTSMSAIFNSSAQTHGV